MKKYTVKEVVNLSNEEIDQIQDQKNTENLAIIEKAYLQKRITPDERDYLHSFYKDGMSVYREVYRTLYELFHHPENTCAFNLKTGTVDLDTFGHHKNYGLKAVTPFTCTRLEYVDKFNNPIYIIVPEMKSASRAVDKLEKEYSKEYSDDLAKIAHYAFEDENREAFAEKLQNIKPKSERLHDILRLTITSKYFSDVERLKRLITEQSKNKFSNFDIYADETRDRFLIAPEKNEKKYYDIKMIMHQHIPNGQKLDVEVQLKIQTLYNADIRTHEIYEKVRQIEDKLTKNPILNSDEDRQKRAQVKILKNKIKVLNENALHQYNMMVIDKACRLEADGYRPLRIEPDSKDGTYEQCRQFILREYLPESSKPFKPEDFSAENEVNKLCYLRLLGKLDNDFNELSDNAMDFVHQKFETLSASEKERFEGINEVARRYEPVISSKIKQGSYAQIYSAQQQYLSR